jgi:DNA invertase Pin-like site-specific DNA recombinase
MTARIVGAVARHESEHKAERIRRQREQAALEGTYHWGRRAFGYDRDGVSLNVEEAALIREAAARVLNGESLRRIADDWNTRGLTSPSGKSWQITTLRSMLAGPRLAGLRVHRGEIVGDAAWPAILERDTFEKLRLILGDPRRHQRGRPPVHLLSGMIRCGRCGGVLHASKRPDGARRYACNVKPGNDNCGRIAIAAEPLEQLIADAVLYRLESPVVAKAMRRKPKRAGDDHAAVVAECERQLTDLATMFGAGTIGRREWLAARKTIEERQTVAQRALARQQGTEALEPLRGQPIAEAWAGLDTERRRAVVAALIDRVVIASANGRSAFAPDRVDIEWRV